MLYDDEIVKKMLDDPRWFGVLTEKMTRVWKVRGRIPSQYFNQKYVRLLKENNPAAESVHDKYFNEKFVLKTELTASEKKEHDRVLQILTSEKINTSEVFEQLGISIHIYNDAVRATKKVDIRYETVLQIKKNLQELRIEIKRVLEKLQDKRSFSDSDVGLYDSILGDSRLHVLNVLREKRERKPFADRFHQRSKRGSKYYTNDEIQNGVDSFAIFLIETAF